MRKDLHREQYDLTISEGMIQQRERTESNKSKQLSPWAAFEFFGQVGLSVALPLVLCTMVGAYLDAQWHTRPQATVAGLVIGFILSIASFAFSIKQFLKRFNS